MGYIVSEAGCSMTRWFKAAILAVAVAAAAVLAYAVLSPEQTTDQDHTGMWGRPTYSSLKVLLIGVSIVLIVAMLMIALMWHEYEPPPPTMLPPSSAKPPVGDGVSGRAPLDVSAGTHREELEERNYLVLRLLTGDERVMFKAIMDAGGETLQKDLIAATRMSNAKVTRVLDRLAAKGAISKERYGATNKIRIRLDR